MKPYEPICVYCNEPIPSHITPTPVAAGEVATHRVELVAHPSCAYHRKAAFEVDKIQPALHVVDKLILAAMHLKECEGLPGDGEQAECDVEELRNRVIAMIPRPIPVSERLPEDGQQVMAYDESNPNSSPQYKWQGSIFEHGSFFGDWSRWDTPLDNVTHWLPMPPTPE